MGVVNLSLSLSENDFNILNEVAKEQNITWDQCIIQLIRLEYRKFEERKEDNREKWKEELVKLMQEKDPERYKEVKAEYEEEKRKNKKFISKYYEKTLKSSQRMLESLKH